MLSTTKVSVAVMLVAALAKCVEGHGQMTVPKPRQVTAKYRADCYGGLKGAGDDELQWAPVENLSERKQADQPYAPTFDVMNGCRGMVYEASSPVTELTAGEETTIEYYIQAPHPGYMELWIVKPKTDAAGKITYERSGSVLKRIENFATNNAGKSTTVTIPTSVTGCSKAGDCALQFYWHSDLAKQTYPTCADIIVKGAGGGGGAATRAPVTPETPAPTSDEYDDNDTPAATTRAPAATTKAPSPSPSPTKKVCTPKRFRVRR